MPEVRSALAGSTEFNLDLFKGKIAQVIVETIFLEFGFLVHPFGYESYFSSIIKLFSGRSEAEATKIRSMPDLVVVAPDTGRVHILEVKATNSPPEDYALGVRQAEYYRTHWPEADLVVFCIPEREVYAASIGRLPFDSCPIKSFGSGDKGYKLSLAAQFEWLPSRYGLNVEDYHRIIGQMWYQLGKFCDGGRNAA